MPISSRNFVRSTVLMLLVGLAALLVIVATTLWLGARSQHFFDDVMAARDARTVAVDLRNSLQIAETSQRGFLLTGNEDYLARYGPAHDAVPGQFADVRTKLASYPQADQALPHLKQAIDRKLAEMDQTIALRKAGHNSEALAIVNTDKGKELMDEAQVFFARVIGTANDRMATAVQDQRRSAAWLRWVSLIGAVVIIAVVGGSALTVIRYTRDLAVAQREADELARGLEQRVAERTADLARANEEIQRFAYIVTHDLRAPLVNIMGFTSELEASGKVVQAALDKAEAGDGVLDEAKLAAAEDLPEAIDFIRSSTRKMDGLINAILKLSREGRRVLRPERVDLGDLLRNAADAIQHQVSEADGEIRLDVNAPAVLTDKLSVEQIFGNLLDNAVKYRSRERPLRIWVRARTAPDGRIMIEIEDNGRGIAEQDLERVFELFRRSGAQDQPGEGIGLAYVRTVVRNLGGDITLTSTFGSGTTFRVALPRMLRPIGSTVS